MVHQENYVKNKHILSNWTFADRFSASKPFDIFSIRFNDETIEVGIHEVKKSSLTQSDIVNYKKKLKHRFGEYSSYLRTFLWFKKSGRWVRKEVNP